MDTWLAIEDLLLRIAAICHVDAQTDQGRWHVQITPDPTDCHAALPLLQVAAQAATHAWQSDDRHGSFASQITWTGDTLEIAFVALDTVVRWPQGDDLGWQMLALLTRLRLRATRATDAKEFRCLSASQP